MKTNAIRKFWNDQRGQDTVEYALIVAFVAVAAAAISPAVASLGTYFVSSMNVLSAALAITSQ